MHSANSRLSLNVGAKQTALLPPRESIADNNDNKRSGQQTIV